MHRQGRMKLQAPTSDQPWVDPRNVELANAIDWSQFSSQTFKLWCENPHIDPQLFETDPKTFEPSTNTPSVPPSPNQFDNNGQEFTAELGEPTLNGQEYNDQYQTPSNFHQALPHRAGSLPPLQDNAAHLRDIEVSFQILNPKATHEEIQKLARDHFEAEQRELELQIQAEREEQLRLQQQLREQVAYRQQLLQHEEQRMHQPYQYEAATESEIYRQQLLQHEQRRMQYPYQYEAATDCEPYQQPDETPNRGQPNHAPSPLRQATTLRLVTGQEDYAYVAQQTDTPEYYRQEVGAVPQNLFPRLSGHDGIGWRTVDHQHAGQSVPRHQRTLSGDDMNLYYAPTQQPPAQSPYSLETQFMSIGSNYQVNPTQPSGMSANRPGFRIPTLPARNDLRRSDWGTLPPSPSSWPYANQPNPHFPSYGGQPPAKVPIPRLATLSHRPSRLGQTSPFAPSGAPTPTAMPPPPTPSSGRSSRKRPHTDSTTSENPHPAQNKNKSRRTTTASAIKSDPDTAGTPSTSRPPARFSTPNSIPNRVPTVEIGTVRGHPNVVTASLTKAGGVQLRARAYDVLGDKVACPMGSVVKFADVRLDERMRGWSWEDVRAWVAHKLGPADC